MSDLTPPPDEPLPDQSRARIREDLLRAAQDGRPAGFRRWLAPAVAAAAVVLVAGLAAWAVQGGDGGADGSPAAPGTSVRPTPPPLPEPGVTPTGTLPALPDPTGAVQVGSGTCEQELAHVLPGAERAVAFPEDGGTTSFWVKGDELVLCDVRSGTTTVHKPIPTSPPRDVAPFRVSTVLTPVKGGLRATRVAGGLVPAGAEEFFEVSYAFPDGHTEVATKVEDDQGRTWWRMLYSYVDDGGNEMRKPPITATLSYSGVQETYTLDWATDTCAQANHGC